MNIVPLLKYCGNYSFEDVQITANSRANYLGFIFAESKRSVTVHQVKQWLEQIQIPQKIVGVFVNASLEEIESVSRQVRLDVIQCHGEETPDFILTLKAAISQQIWKVVHHSENGLEKMKQYEGLVDGYVVDSKVSGQRGGTGQTFDWSSIPSYQKEAFRQQVPIFIAGGINPQTVKELLLYQPVGIDLSSGIEENGRKSIEIKNQLEKRVFS
jgi:phosphoribosylanthranilate isomerase